MANGTLGAENGLVRAVNLKWLDVVYLVVVLFSLPIANLCASMRQLSIQSFFSKIGCAMVGRFANWGLVMGNSVWL